MKHFEASHDKREADGAQAPYEPPAMVVLGSVKKLTEGGPTRAPRFFAS